MNRTAQPQFRAADARPTVVQVDSTDAARVMANAMRIRAP
jgi:hypothetical protein